MRYIGNRKPVTDAISPINTGPNIVAAFAANTTIAEAEAVLFGNVSQHIITSATTFAPCKKPAIIASAMTS